MEQMESAQEETAAETLTKKETRKEPVQRRPQEKVNEAAGRKIGNDNYHPRRPRLKEPAIANYMAEFHHSQTGC